MHQRRRRPLLARELASHLARIAICATAVALSPWPWATVIAAALLFLAAFALAHDLTHDALGLPRQANQALLAAAGLVMLLDGHGMRRMHLRHHARPLEEGDLEGEGARRSALGALLVGPFNALALRAAALRGAPPSARGLQLAELAGSTLVVALALFGPIPLPALRLHVLVALSLQATMSLWASHVPHRTPAWLARVARRLAFTRSPILLSLAFHGEHHATPRVPCARLAAVARRRAPAALTPGYGGAGGSSGPSAARSYDSSSPG